MYYFDLIVKADEKTRRDLYKLRHTWSPYFPAKMLHDLDVSVNKHDPGWPISAAPPPSPSIHINPKFLKKVRASNYFHSKWSYFPECYLATYDLSHLLILDAIYCFSNNIIIVCTSIFTSCRSGLYLRRMVS